MRSSHTRQILYIFVCFAYRAGCDTTRDGGLPNLTRETKHSDANGDREHSIFPVWVTTRRIGPYTRLMPIPLKVNTTHTQRYLVTYDTETGDPNARTKTTQSANQCIPAWQLLEHTRHTHSFTALKTPPSLSQIDDDVWPNSIFLTILHHASQLTFFTESLYQKRSPPKGLW